MTMEESIKEYLSSPIIQLENDDVTASNLVSSRTILREENLSNLKEYKSISQKRTYKTYFFNVLKDCAQITNTKTERRLCCLSLKTSKINFDK